MLRLDHCGRVPDGIAQRDGVRIDKTGAGPHELEFSGGQARAAVLGEIGDHGVFAGHDRFEIEACLWNAESPGFGGAREMEHLGGIKKRLAGHATAQNALSPHLRPALDDNRFESRLCRRARRRVTRAAPAQDGEVEARRIPL